MTNKVTAVVAQMKVEDELYRFNIDQVNNFINFYNNYGRRLYFLEKGLDVDRFYNPTTEIAPEGCLICESVDEIEYIRNQFQRLCEINMKMLKEHMEQTKPSTSMIALMKAIMKLGRQEPGMELGNRKLL
ncbi:unnamed protein product [Rodentolepis nana]|uniref:DHC_N1 domain-containing protein n=1 Tax=Rodentolepis nana TaxID=102285 RepID=A0A0R3TM59_RODNA|nr:unnamed protein product [Rodentolepis nana]